MRVLILLPPSEGKTAPRRGKPLDLGTLSLPDLAPARERVLDALVSLCSSDPERAAEVLEVPKSALELVGLNARVRTAPTARADQVYSGVLYDALSPATLSPAARRRATSRLMVTSSLFGLVGPADRIPAYRLSGDAVLPGLGGVAAVWRDALGPPVADAIGDGLLVDLRSSMYAAFWRPPPTMARRVATVRVLHEVNGKRQVVSHFNKSTKGRIVRALLEDGANPRTPAKLADVLRDLGWTVETETGKAGTRLDVVVSTSLVEPGGALAPTVSKPGVDTLAALAAQPAVSVASSRRGAEAVLAGRATVVEPQRGALGEDVVGRVVRHDADRGGRQLHPEHALEGRSERAADEDLDRGDVADDHHGASLVRLTDPVERGEHARLDGPERLAALGGVVEVGQPGLQTLLVGLADLGEGQPVPDAELHLGEAGLLLDRSAEQVAEDLRRLARAAYG